MKKHLFTILMILLTIQIYSQDKAIKITLTDGTEIHYPISSGEKVSKLTFVADACDGVREVAYSGKIYHAVQIGDQCWLKENLNVGTKINSSTAGQQQTANGTIEKYCYNNDENNCDIYGGLYEWNEAMQYVTAEEGAKASAQVAGTYPNTQRCKHYKAM